MQNELLVIKYRWPIIIGCLLVTVFFGFQLRKIAIDPDFLNLLPPTMASRINTSKIEEVFGSNDMLFVLFETDDVLNGKTLSRIESITNEFHDIDGVQNIMSLFDTKKITGEEGAMFVEPAVSLLPESAEEREILRKELTENELAMEIVVSKDFKLTAIILTLSADADKRSVYRAVDSIITAIPGQERVYLGGAPAFEYRIVNDVAKDLLILIPAALLVIFVVLYGFFRQKRGVLLPFGVIVLSVLVGMGILPVMGWKITVVTVLLPIMVVAFANNYGLYIIAMYNELCSSPIKYSRNEIITTTIKNLRHPILFTGVTTIAGILGLVSHILVPAKQIGIAAAIAIAFSIFVSLFGIPAVLSLLPLPAAKSNNRKTKSWKFLEDGLSHVSHFVVSRPITIIVVALIVVVLAAAGALLLRVDANQENLFAKNHPVRQCSALVNKHFGGSQSISVLVEGDIKDPELLQRLESYKDTLQRMEGVGQITSMADILRIMSKALNDKDDPNYNQIPKTRDAVAQYLELYSMNGDPSDFERLVDFNYEKTQFVVRLTSDETPVINDVVSRIEKISKHDNGFRAVGGFAKIFSELSYAMIRGQISSILFALLAIVLLVILLFRSPVAGLLCSIPLIIAIIIGFGVMGVFGISLNVATALIMSIVIGTGVDYSIQFLWRYREVLQSGADNKRAMLETLTTTGKAVTFNAMSVTAGFGVLLMGSLPPLKTLALLFGVLTVVCMLVTLTLIPALCVVFKPRFLFNTNVTNNI